jgi:uncharacterized Fe-S cluster-containing MiaB family protein
MKSIKINYTYGAFEDQRVVKLDAVKRILKKFKINAELKEVRK